MLTSLQCLLVTLMKIWSGHLFYNCFTPNLRLGTDGCSEYQIWVSFTPHMLYLAVWNSLGLCRWLHSCEVSGKGPSSSSVSLLHFSYVLKNVWYSNSPLYRVSQEECARLRDSVPCVKLYRYNPKHLYPKLNGYGDNGQRSFKLWQLLLTYWLPNAYWNWQDYVVSVMLIAVRNIKVTCEWHKAIKLNYKNTRTRVIVVLRFPSTLRRPQLLMWRQS